MLENMVKKLSEKYVITTAQYGAALNKEFYQNIKKYCSINDAKLIVVPTSGKNITEEPILHPILQEDSNLLITDSYKFNNNLKLKDFGVRPQAINIFTGLDRFAQGDTSYIMPGTKQFLKYIANSHNTHPKALISTGAITHPYYNERHRIGRIAKEDHSYGMVVVEKLNNTYFHFRQVRAMKNGKFTDLGMNYANGRKPTRAKTLAMIPGDVHVPYLNKEHKKATFEQMEYFKPEKLFLHDLFDGQSISHHYQGDNATYYKMSKLQGLDLEKELKETLKVLSEYSSKIKGDVFIVPSNHNEHLDRYLQEGRFIRDKGNDLIASQLYVGLLQGHNPLEYGFNLIGQVPSNVHFLNRNDDYKIRGFQLAKHNDKGASGARGSQRSAEIANGKSILGHSHTPSIIRNTYTMGTSTDLLLDYNAGYYSAWVNTNAVLYEDGSVQLINTLKGSKWRLL